MGGEVVWTPKNFLRLRRASMGESDLGKPCLIEVSCSYLGKLFLSG